MKPQDWTNNSQQAFFNALKLIGDLLCHESKFKQVEKKYGSTRPREVFKVNGNNNGTLKTVTNITESDRTGFPPSLGGERITANNNKPMVEAPVDCATIISQKWLSSSSPPTALKTLCEAFRLSKFECQTLLLIAGAEIMPSFRTLIGKLEGSSKLSYPTFYLALRLFKSIRDFSYFSLSKNGPLLDWELIRFKSSEDGRFFKALEVDGKILDYLLGYSVIDRRLDNYIFPRSANDFFPFNTKSFEDISVGITRAIESSIAVGTSMPLIQLCGSSINLKRQILATTLESSGFSLCELPWILMPKSEEELKRFCLLWTREASLDDRVLLINCEDIGKSDSEHLNLLNKFLTMIDVPIVIAATERLASGDRLGIHWEIPKLTYPEQHHLWQMSLGEYAPEMPQQIENLVANFQLSPQEIDSAVRTSLATASSYEQLCENLWSTCRDRARPKLDELAKRIKPSAKWSDLILPADRKEMLREMVAQVKHRTQVFERWNFGKKNNRGLGLCALFAGTSGTGKTMAAEVLAHELNLDLYRIDLSTVVSKYIGETEKNLKKLFDAAESGGVILLFDEGDALFGKRTEANDSKDKYANMEVSYLLQRIESYSGLAIITTNIEDSLDSAFMRRLRYIVKFPFPGATERANIWKRVYPEGVFKDPTPRAYEMLGQMEISGGLIYSIALKSAFIAADEGADGVYLDHIEKAAKSEYTKIGRSLSMSETPWVHSRNFSDY